MTQEYLSLELGNDLINMILDLAIKAGSKPLTVCVVDSGGVMVAAQRQDGCGIARPKLSMAKARSTLELNMPTRTLSNFYEANENLHAELKSIIGKDLTPLLGGVIIKNNDERIIGAVGVSGGDLNEEEGFAITAIRRLGLVPDPIEPLAKTDTKSKKR